MDGVWSEDKWQKRGDTIKSCSLLHMNANTRSVFCSEFLQYTELLEKILHAEREAHVTAESEAANGGISLYFLKSSFFFYHAPPRKCTFPKKLSETTPAEDFKSIVLKANWDKNIKTQRQESSVLNRYKM